MKRQILLSLLIILPFTASAESVITSENESAQVELMLMGKHPICTLGIQEIQDCYACGSPYAVENDYTRITLSKKNGLLRRLTSGISYDDYLKTLLDPSKVRTSELYKELQLFRCFNIEK